MSTLLVREEPVVFVVDPEPEIGQTLRSLAVSLELQVESYVAAEAFLSDCDPTQPGCIFLDLSSPKSEGLLALRRLAEAHVHLPVVAIIPGGDVARASEALKAGAYDVLPRPWTAGELELVLHQALRWDAENRQDIVLVFKVHHRLGRLTPGEREVLELLIHGHSNKRVAEQLELSVRAVEVRRAAVMRKMKAKGLADLVRLVLTARYFGSRVQR